MATERLIIEVTERGTRRVRTRIERLGEAAIEASKGTALLNRDLKKTGRRGREAGQGFQRAEKGALGARDAFRGLRAGLAGLGVALVTREFIKFSDAATTLTNRLRVVTDTQEQLASVQGQLFAISERTRSSVESNAELFSRLAVAASELGKTQSELLQFTESLNKAIKIGGATAQEAGAGLIQLSQGLASGALRGDELRSVLEQLPVVAQVIADSLGVTRGELRKLGEDGKITAEVIFDAFKESREELDERFAKTVPTIAESFVQLSNSVIELAGAFNELTGASGLLAEGIGAVASAISTTAAAINSVSTQNITRIFNILLFGQEEVIERESRLLDIIEKSRRETRLRAAALEEEARKVRAASEEQGKLVAQLKAEVIEREKLKQLIAERAEPPTIGEGTISGTIGLTPLGRLTPEEEPDFSDFDQSLIELENSLLDIGNNIRDNFSRTFSDIGKGTETLGDKFSDLGAGIKSSFAKVDTSIKGLGSTIGTLFVGAIDQASVALADFAIDGFQNTEDLKAAFSDLFRTLARDILAATIRLIILRSLFGETGSGGLVGFLGSIGSNQIGGPLSSGETSIVGERGPELFTAPQGGGRITRNEDLGSLGRPVVNLRIVNVLPEDAAGMQGEEGEEFVLNVIQKNSSTVRETLN